MQYDDMDLATEWRNAYAAADDKLAAAFALALDLTDAQAEADRLKGVVDGIRALITEANWRTGKKAELRELVEAIVNELAEGAA